MALIGVIGVNGWQSWRFGGDGITEHFRKYYGTRGKFNEEPKETPTYYSWDFRLEIRTL